VREPPWRIEADGLLMLLGLTPRGGHLLAGASVRPKRVRFAGAGTTLAAALEKICAMG
jgi:hypothetical protein